MKMGRKRVRDAQDYQRWRVRPKSRPLPTLIVMETLYDVLKYVHIAAWIVVILGYLKDVRGPVVNGWMAHGLTVAFLLGLGLTGIASASDAVDDPNNAKVAVKLVVALVALGLAHATRKRPAPNPIAHVVAALVVVNVAIAYAW